MGAFRACPGRLRRHTVMAAAKTVVGGAAVVLLCLAALAVLTLSTDDAVGTVRESVPAKSPAGGKGGGNQMDKLMAAVTSAMGEAKAAAQKVHAAQVQAAEKTELAKSKIKSATALQANAESAMHAAHRATVKASRYFHKKWTHMITQHKSSKTPTTPQANKVSKSFSDGEGPGQARCR